MRLWLRVRMRERMCVRVRNLMAVTVLIPMSMTRSMSMNMLMIMPKSMATKTRNCGMWNMMEFMMFGQGSMVSKCILEMNDFRWFAYCFLVSR